MSLLIDAGDRPVQAVLHPTDLSEASVPAFHTALAVGLRYGARVTLLHAIGRRSTDSWSGFPSVRETLARWTEAGGLSAEAAGGSSVRKVEVDVRDPVQACLDYAARHEVGLIVLATEGRDGLSRLVRASHAERLGRESGLPSLFVPRGGRSFVTAATGHLGVERILLPVGEATDPRAAMLFAARTAAAIGNPDIEITLLHVDGGRPAAERVADELPYCRWRLVSRPGDPVSEILAVAEEVGSDAIFMATSWRRSGRGGLRPGVTERVLRAAPCPVVTVPA